MFEKLDLIDLMGVLLILLVIPFPAMVDISFNIFIIARICTVTLRKPKHRYLDCLMSVLYTFGIYALGVFICFKASEPFALPNSTDIIFFLAMMFSYVGFRSTRKKIYAVAVFASIAAFCLPFEANVVKDGTVWNIIGSSSFDVLFITYFRVLLMPVDKNPPPPPRKRKEKKSRKRLGPIPGLMPG